MAKQTLTRLTDDLDGTEAVEEVIFAVRGTEYEIDLNAKNLAAFDKALEKFIKGARRVPHTRSTRAPRGSVRPRSKGSARKDNVAGIREWARAAGYEVSSRGRISATIREAYEAAQG
jgi:Lsr2